MTYEIVDIDGLAKILRASRFTLKKNWRSLPHFFIGDGTTLKGARFDVAEVIEHLKREVNHVRLERPQKRCLDSEIQFSKQATQKGRIRNESQCIEMGSGTKKQLKTSTRAGADPFDLLSGINNVS